MQQLSSPRKGLHIDIILIVVTALFCFSCLALSALTPSLGFDVGIQTVQDGTGVAVRHVTNSSDDIQTGDVIEAVSGNVVRTRAGFYHQIFGEKDTIELTIRRYGGRYQRPVSAQEFAHGAMPAGVQADDIPVMIADEGSRKYAPLENVDLPTLHSMLEARGGRALVVFKRQQEPINVTVHVQGSFGRTGTAALICLILALMAIAARKRQNGRERANIVLAFAGISVLTLGLWPVLINYPAAFVLGIVGLTLFKVLDFDYHLMHFGRRRVDTWARIALFSGPIATLLVPVWLCISEMPVLWGADVNPVNEIRLESFVVLPMIWVIAYTILDGSVLIVRRRRHETAAVQPYEIGVGIASLLSLFAFALIGTGLAASQMFLMAAIIVQAVSNVMSVFTSRSQSDSHIRLDNPIFSASPIREALDAVREAIGDEYLIQIVIDRPSPKHVVGMARAQDAEDINGLELNVLSENWRNFLDIFHIENSVITGDSADANPRDPVQDMAARLGILIALPISDNTAGTLTNLTFLISTRHTPDPDHLPSISLSPAQRGILREAVERLSECGPAMVYLSAEMSLEYVGEDIDLLMRQAHETASFARALKDPTGTLSGREIPHGLLDEDDDVPENAHDPAVDDSILVDNPELGIDEYETKEYEEEVSFLKSQVQALYSQQMREYALSEIDLTQSQKAVLDDTAALDPPIMFIGEIGTGKKLLALASHQRRKGDGPFLTIDASSVPESIFVLDIFGEGDNPGMISGAAGGSLLIQNADRLSDGVIDDIVCEMNKLAPNEAVDLYLSVNIGADDMSVVKFRIDPFVLPKSIARIAGLWDAEIAALDPLRDQNDLEMAAEFFRQKQAARSNKPVDGFDNDAMAALKSAQWTGNFTELRAVVERAVMRCESARIKIDDLGKDFVDLADASTKNLAIDGSDVFREQVQVMQMLNETLQNQVLRLTERNKELELMAAGKGESASSASENSISLDGTFADIEKRMLIKILDKYQGDPERAAAELECNRARLFSKLSKYQILDRP